MSIERCSNPACHQRFEVIEFGHTRPAQPEPRRLVCPYCGHTVFRKTRGAFIVSRLEGDPFDDFAPRVNVG
jgi:DNA-directed RNA polymerase subunit RPC12/RpoP